MMGFIYISLMINDVEHLSSVFFNTIWICSLEKCLSKSSAHFLNWIVWIFAVLSYLPLKKLWIIFWICPCDYLPWKRYFRLLIFDICNLFGEWNHSALESFLHIMGMVMCQALHWVARTNVCLFFILYYRLSYPLHECRGHTQAFKVLLLMCPQIGCLFDSHC